MRSKIFMYLFIFSILLVLFMYMNQKKIYEDQETKIEKLSVQLEEERLKNELLTKNNFELNYFSFLENDNAMSYFEQSGYEASDIERMVTEQIYTQNQAEGDNPLIPYSGMEGSMKINKVRFLNHKWVIADFTDGRYWGEMIIQYDLDEDKNLTLNTVSSLLYSGM